MEDIKQKILTRIEEYKNLGYKANDPIIGGLHNGGISISKGDKVYKLANEIIISDESLNKNGFYFRNGMSLKKYIKCLEALSKLKIYQIF